jgi:hypothetical protein
MRAAILTFSAVVLLWGLHRFLSYAEERGWVYYRKKRGSYGGLGVTSNFLNMYDPGRRHLQQVMREGEWKRDEDDDGDQPSREALRLTSQPPRDALRLTNRPKA